MKNNSTNFRFALSSFLTIVLFFNLSLKTQAQDEVYQIQNPVFTMICSGKLKDWKPSLDNVAVDGKFLVKNDSIREIADLKFSFKVGDSSKKKTKVITAINKSVQNDQDNALVFDQENMMILPVMKIAHLTMDAKMPTGGHFLPLLLNYTVEEDHSISVSGTQVMWLYQFGILPRNIKDSHVRDQMTLDIKFKLVKSANLLANQPVLQKL